jgi:hypothetical protein
MSLSEITESAVAMTVVCVFLFVQYDYNKKKTDGAMSVVIGML